MTADLYENSGGELLLVTGDKAHDVTAVQSDSTLIADAESYAEGVWEGGDPGAVYDRVEALTFERRDNHRDRVHLVGWTHVATYENGSLTRHAEGGLAASNYLSTNNLGEGVLEHL